MHMCQTSVSKLRFWIWSVHSFHCQLTELCSGLLRDGDSGYTALHVQGANGERHADSLDAPAKKPILSPQFAL